MRFRSMLPVSWGYEPLKFHVTFSKGLAIQKSDLIDEGIAVVNYGQIHAKSNSGVHLADDLIRYVPLRFALQSASACLHRGDVVYADTSEDIDGVGNAVFIDSSGEIFAGYHTLTCRPDGTVLLGDYLAFLSQSDWWRAQLRSMVTGVKVYSITKSIMSRVWIPLPPLREQQGIVSRLNSICDDIDNSTRTIEGQISVLERYRASVIYEAVTKGLDFNVSMKSSGVDWIGDIPKGWECKKLKYCYKFMTGFTPDTSNAAYYDNDGFTWVSIADLTSAGTIINTSETGISEIFVKEKHPQLTPEGSLLYSFKLSVGKCAFAGRPLYTNEAIASFLPSGENSLRYLYYASSLLINNANENIYSAKLLNRNLIANAPIPLPPVAEQMSIADYLDTRIATIDAILEIKRKQIDVLRRRRQSLIYEYVTGKRRVKKEM